MKFIEFALTTGLALGAGLAVFRLCALRFANDTRGNARSSAQNDFLARSSAQNDFLARWSDLIFAAMAIAFVIVFGGLAVLRYQTFHTGYLDESTAWDLGQYHQIVWNSLHGRLFENTYILDARNFLGKTFTPLLLALVPLYAIFPDAQVLLTLQTLGLAAGAFPLYWFARARVGRLLALALAFIYFLSPAVLFINFHEFHEVGLTTPVVAFAAFFLSRRHYRAFLVCVLIGLLLKEEMAIIAAGMGLYILVAQKNWKLGLGLTAFGALAIVLLLQYVIPFFRGAEFGAAFYYFGKGALAGGGARYGYLGNSIGEIALTLLTRPDIVLPQFFSPHKIEYVLHFLTPLAFLPLVGIEVFALAFPTMAYSMLSTYPLQSSIHFSYYAPFVPFVFFAATVGAQRALKFRAPAPAARAARRFALAAALAVAGAMSYYLYSPGPFARNFQEWRYQVNDHTRMGQALARQIPLGALVVAQNEMLAALSNRAAVYEIPIPDYRQVEYLLADSTRPWYNVHRAYWEEFMLSGYFEIITQHDGWLLAKRRAPAHPLEIRFGDQMTLTAYTLVPYDGFKGGETLRPFVEWRAEKNLATRYVIEANLVDARGRVWSKDNREPLDRNLPTDQWKKDQRVQDQYKLHLDHFMPTGDYFIVLRVQDRETGKWLAARDTNDATLGAEITLARVNVAKSKANLTADQITIEERLYVDMRELRFLGFVPPRESIAPGELLQVGLYWRAREKPRGDYLVAVQVRDAAGRVAFEHSARPAADTYPTTQWDAGEVLLDWHDFYLPSDLARGEYKIYVALTDAATRATVGEAALSKIQVK